MAELFRCSGASLADGEQMLGTAPTDRAFVLVEYDGAWGAQAVAQSGLPAQVKAFLGGLTGVGVFLIRRRQSRSGLASNGRLRLFTALAADAGFVVETTLLERPDELLELDLGGLGQGRSAQLTPHREPLWLVCTNGKRDRCCAEIGRAVLQPIAAHWPEATWEITHLGGHRFAGTVLGLPSGITLGRLRSDDAVAQAEAALAGAPTRQALRGVAGLSGAAQVAQAVAAERLGVALAQVRVLAHEADHFVMRAGEQTLTVTVETTLGPARRQSCGDLKEKSSKRYRVADVG